MKYVLPMLAVAIVPSAARYECVRWTWTGDVYNRNVICLEWRDKNASKEKANNNKEVGKENGRRN